MYLEDLILTPRDNTARAATNPKSRLSSARFTPNNKKVEYVKVLDKYQVSSAPLLPPLSPKVQFIQSPIKTQPSLQNILKVANSTGSTATVSGTSKTLTGNDPNQNGLFGRGRNSLDRLIKNPSLSLFEKGEKPVTFDRKSSLVSPR